MMVADRAGVAGLRVGVAGAGRSGRAAMGLLERLGARPYVADEKDRPDAFAALADADLVILSPGIPVTKIRAAGYRGPIWGEMELAARVLPVRPLAVTGTNGKTTTATLLAHILSETNPGRRVHLRGNVGEAVSEVADAVAPEDLVVLEASSYQLETIETFAPSVAVLLNVAPDHLERYADLTAYAAAKERIFENQRPGDAAVVVVDDEPSRAALARVPTGVRRIPVTCRDPRRAPIPECAGFVPEENRRAAVEAAVASGVLRAAAERALATFRPLPHRLETVAEIGGVRWIDDSKATNFHAVVFALRHVPRPVVLLLGGRGKGEDPATLLPYLEGVERVVAFGEMRRSVTNALGSHVPVTSVDTMNEAIHAAFNAATDGTSVLLSPGGSSFDAFRDYAERGRIFAETVRTLSR